MPKYRTIRTDYITSERVSSLSLGAEVLFMRLMLVADDFGLFDANPKLVQRLCCPLRDVRDADCSRWLLECETSGLIRRYAAAGKPYLQIIRFGQRLKQSQPKYPPPPWDYVEAASPTGFIPESDGIPGKFPEVPGSSGNFPSNPNPNPNPKENPKPPLRPGGGRGGAPPGQEELSTELPEALRTELFAKSWAEWQQHRREKRQKPTPTATAKQLKMLAEIGETAAIACIDKSIRNGWIGLFPDGGKDSTQPKGQADPEARDDLGFPLSFPKIRGEEAKRRLAECMGLDRLPEDTRSGSDGAE